MSYIIPKLQEILSKPCDQEIILIYNCMHRSGTITFLVAKKTSFTCPCVVINYFGLQISGLQVYETNEKELILEPSIKWAGNPNIILVVKVLSVPITIQVRRA